MFNVPASQYYVYCSGALFNNPLNACSLKVNGVDIGMTRVTAGSVYGFKSNQKFTAANGDTVQLTFILD